MLITKDGFKIYTDIYGNFSLFYSISNYQKTILSTLQLTTMKLCLMIYSIHGSSRQSCYLKKVFWLRTAILLKKRLWQVFSCEFCEILTTPFLQNTSGRLLLHSISNYQKMIILTLQSTSHEICQKIILSTLQLTSHEIMSHDLHHTC